MKEPLDKGTPPDDQANDRAARRLAAIIESSDDAIVSKDLNGIVTSWNQAAERMFGYTAAEMVGQSITTIIPEDRLHEEREVLTRIRRGDKVDHFETLRRHKSGKLVPISLTVSPIRDAGGTVIGASKIARDISYRLEAESERARLLAEVQRHAAVAEKLNEVGAAVASSLDEGQVLQVVLDASIELMQAQVGQFDPTFRESLVRDDAGGGERAFGTSVRSYLAVPVKSRSGDIIGGLLFGHAEPGRFTADHGRLAAGIATWASVALENARLYKAVHEASRLKDEFLATLSHELRTPLNAILGYSRMLRTGQVEATKGDRAMEVIERNATALAQIVEDVLDVSRITAGKVRLNIQEVDPVDLVTNSILSVAPAADARGVRIETSVHNVVGSIAADADRLQQVLWNLLSNAVKFTGRGGRVLVELSRNEGDVEIVVSDTGVGIPSDFLPYLFDRFRQGDARTTREQGGLGLGLAIARHFIEMHGGTISAWSAGEGQGSTFRVRLPAMSAFPALRPEREAIG